MISLNFLPLYLETELILHPFLRFFPSVLQEERSFSNPFQQRSCYMNDILSYLYHLSLSSTHTYSKSKVSSIKKKNSWGEEKDNDFK